MMPGSKGLSPTWACSYVGERPWNPPQYEHKSRM